MKSEERAAGNPAGGRAHRAPGAPHALTLMVFIYLLVFATVWGHSQGAAPPAGLIAGASAPPNLLELEPVAVPEPSPEAMRYYRSGNVLWVVNRIWALVVPGALAFSGLSARLRNLARRLGRGWFLTIGFYMIMFLAIVYVIDLPLAFYQGFVRQHAYGLSNQSLARWARNYVVRAGVDMAVAFALVWVPYLLLARSPRRWWLYLAILSVPFLFATMLIVPVFYDPLFNQFGPMKNKELERSILDLASRAGIEGSRVFEVDKSADTRAVNAYVTGFWHSKRIVLWDTLIAKLTEPELLVVMGHEMGHYALGHVVRSILLSSIVTFVGLLLVDRLGRFLIGRFRERLRFDQLGEIASVPLMMMLLELAFLLLNPIAMAYSRYQEHEADRYALDLTHANHAAATAHVKLQTENLGNPRPGLLFTIFRASHPSGGDRIDFANSYHPWRSDHPRDKSSHEPGREESAKNSEMETPSARH